MMEPLVSIILPAYNAEKTISTIIRSTINQTYKNYEIIIVDDGSQDQTAQIIESFGDSRIILIKNKINMKLARSLNVAIEAARGDYIARCDADDINMPDRLELLINFLESNPDVDVVGSDLYIIDKNGTILGKYIIPDCDNNILMNRLNPESPVFHPTIMARAAWMKKFKYREEYSRAQDRELFFRAYHQTKFANVHLPLYAYYDPEVINIRKLALSLWFNFKMRWDNRKECTMPINWLLSFPLLAGGRFIYYLITALLGHNLFWKHMTPVNTSDSRVMKDQQWIYYCRNY